MKNQPERHSPGNVDHLIIAVRGQRVILDSDLAAVYGVSTKRLNEQVKRNEDRFPADFAFQLTATEKAEVVANCDHLARIKFSPVLPRAFTEHGAIMDANVLNEAAIVDVLQRIMKILDPPPPPPEPPPPEIGFHVREEPVPYRIRRKRAC